jgi:hypothetical protein
MIAELIEVSLIRDRQVREMAGIRKKTIDCETTAMNRNLHYVDLCRKVEHNSEQMRELGQMDEPAEIEGNRNMNHIQTSRQLENEVELLRREFEQAHGSVKL